MTPQQFVAVGLRLVAIFLAFYSLRFLVALPASMVEANLAEQIRYAFMIGGASLMMAVVFWFFPMAITHRILPRTHYKNVITLQSLEAARVGTALIGLWCTVKVLPLVVWFFFSRLVNSSNQSLYRSLTPQDRLEAVFLIAELVFSLALVLKAGVFARWVLGQTVAREAAAESGE